MKDITEEKLRFLGFKKEVSSPEESGTEEGYHYYTYDVGEVCFLISDTNDENDGNFTIEFFDFDSIKITTYVDLEDLIRVIKKTTEK